MKSSALNLALALSGIGLAALGARGSREGFSFQPNPLGVKGSSYGAVLAMAMQAPIDTYWHGGSEDHSHCDHDHGVCTHDHDHDHDHDEEEADHDHEGEGGHHHEEEEEKILVASPASWNGRLTNYLESLESAVNARTNPRAVSDAHKFYTRRKTEDKLRFAYELDPTHYGNYNSYQFFLNEPAVGTRGALTREAADLAVRTINYCLKIDNDPRPALTAASAAENLLLIMFQDPAKYPMSEMQRIGESLDIAMVRHDRIFAEWQRDGRLENLSEMRRQEIAERRLFTDRIRRDCKATLLRLESQPAAPRQPQQQSAAN